MNIKKFIYPFIIVGFFLKSALALQDTQLYENHLNEMKTLSGEFTQVNSNGKIASGTIQISRPGKMRLTYNPPSNLLIIANGKWLITKNREDDQVDYVSLDKTPAAFILRSHIRFSGDVEITNIIPKGETTEISLIRKEEPDEGYITLVFKNNPIALKEWSIMDAQGVQTRVILSNIKLNLDLPLGLFAIEIPNLIQQIF